MAMALHLKPHITLRRNPNLIIHLFSTSSSSNNGEESNNNNNDNTRSPSPLQSHFKDVKASLRQTPTSPQQTRPSFSFSTPSRTADLDEIRKNLSQFRSKSAPEPSAQSPPPPQQSTRAISFQELYKRNVMQKNEGGPNGNKTGVMVDVIRESLKNMKNTQSKNQGSHVNKDILRQTLNTSPTSGPTFTGKKSSVVLGGSETAPPPSFLTKETSGKTEGEKKNELVKSYSYDELGVKLRKLRPTDGKVIGNNWLSFKELNERLVKLREAEEREMTSSGSMFMGLRESLMKLNDKSANNNKKSQPAVRLDFLSTLGGTETFLRGDPKEHLVEKYFHPDNMSSAEKLKLELKKIRDEFKLSESDCGSSRVQVAQLTVKIKHLSSVLHKKDKHSRKGLQEMVQRRKKLLKYLRRTDWDSYCFCLSKLGLRDNPDYKN